MRRGTLLVLLCVAALGVGGAALLARERMARCAYVPLLAGERLPNADLLSVGAERMPQGWASAANGVELRGPKIGNGEGFDLDGDGRALQLIGVANYVETPPIDVRPGASYCFAGRAITDSEAGSDTRLRVAFSWRDAQGHVLAENATAWQTVVLWREDAPPDGWSPIEAAFRAPPGATSLRVRMAPASDDRIYLDHMRVRRTTDDQRAQPSAIGGPRSVVVEPWPNGYRGALSFSFDWETAMGGLIHSLSDDVTSSNPIDRGLRMRAGVTTTLDLFRPSGIRATYYANGYNFLPGNTEKRQFMGNPTFAWARPASSDRKGWSTGRWTTTPWFAADPYGTARSDPAWYFGDLIPMLVGENQDIQTHTFSHLYGAYASPDDWRADLQAWRDVAGERGVLMARSLAFPWSSSAGMSYANWEAIEAAGITSVTRTNINLPQFQLADRANLRCKPVPGHERILACPDFYLHDRGSAAQAIELIDRVIAGGGMIDLWAHTEEVTSPEQIAAWGEVVRYAARQRDAGALWIAPLAEIADWQAAVAELSIENEEWRNQGDTRLLSFVIHNGNQRDLSSVTLKLPFQPKKITVAGTVLNSQSSILNLDIAAGQTLEVQVWPA